MPTPAFESIKVTAPMMDMIRRRTEWIARDFLAFDRSLKTALATAYLAGMNDAVDVLRPRKP